MEHLGKAICFSSHPGELRAFPGSSKCHTSEWDNQLRAEAVDFDASTAIGPVGMEFDVPSGKLT